MERSIGKAGGFAVSVVAPESFETNVERFVRSDTNGERGVLLRGGEGPRPLLTVGEARGFAALLVVAAEELAKMPVRSR
jgi:hypothetical protein